MSLFQPETRYSEQNGWKPSSFQTEYFSTLYVHIYSGFYHYAVQHTLLYLVTQQFQYLPRQKRAQM